MRPGLQRKLFVDRVCETRRPVTTRVGGDDRLDGGFAYEGWIGAGVICIIISTLFINGGI
jgi:hypothetical protein